MLKILPIIPSSTFQKFNHYNLFLFYSHIITYIISILFFMLYYQVLTSREHGLDTYFTELLCKCQWCVYIQVEW